MIIREKETGRTGSTTEGPKKRGHRSIGKGEIELETNVDKKRWTTGPRLHHDVLEGSGEGDPG